MICGRFHAGSGLGDQLFRYITTRTIAEDKGYSWGMIGNFKGDSFMQVQKFSGATPPTDSSVWKYWDEKEIRLDGIDVRSYDPEINFVQDNTIIDGCFEDYKYWGHKLPQIREWLKVEPIEVPDDVCVIGFRGGEYYTDPNLGLPPEYFWEGVKEMQKINPAMKFEVHTDDKQKAAEIFAGFPIIQDIGINWRSMRYAKHAIIANSAFYIIPRLLSGGITIAPRYWARRNIKTWARPACYYNKFTYI